MATYDQVWQTAVAQLPEHAATTAMLATALVVLVIPRLRKLVWDTVETTLASLLLVLLVLMVLGLPFGKCTSCWSVLVGWHTSRFLPLYGQFCAAGQQ